MLCAASAVSLCVLWACETRRTSVVQLGSFTEEPVATVDVDLDGQQVRPMPSSTEASGQATLVFTRVVGGILGGNTVMHMMHFEVTAQSLDSVTSVHVHGPSGAEEVGPILATLLDTPSGSEPVDGPLVSDSVPYSYGFEFDDNRVAEGVTVGDIVALTLQGLVYVDVHTRAYPDGEIRGHAPGVVSPSPAAPAPGTASSRTWRPARPARAAGSGSAIHPGRRSQGR